MAEGHRRRVAAVLGQARLRAKARVKFGDFAHRMLFTPEGLEQATRLRVASVHAGRFAGAGIDVVADLGCVIGADSLALAALELALFDARFAVDHARVAGAAGSWLSGALVATTYKWGFFVFGTFAYFLLAASRQPNLMKALFNYAILGFALTDAGVQG